MGALLSRVSTVSSPARMQALTTSRPDAFSDFWYDGSASLRGADGVGPELALTLSYVYCAVDTISADFGTSTCQFFKELENGGRNRVKYSDAGIGALAYRCRWQPNIWQTAKAFWSTLVWQYLLRPAAYAEIIYRPGSDSFVEQLVPRHPDRVRQERLPNGRLRFRIADPDGPRYVTQDEMFVVRNTSSDGLNAISRVDYGSQAIGSGLAMQDFTRIYWKKGAVSALVATYKDARMAEEDEAALHASLTRYSSGVENAGGILLVPEDIDIKTLSVDPEKAQLAALKNLSGRDVARLFKMPPSWLGIEGAASYGSQLQDATNYQNRCQMPIAVEFEQAIQRDLIVAPYGYFAKFNMDYQLRGNLLERMQAYEIGIRNRVLRPSEARVREDMNPDDRLDELSEHDFQPGKSNGNQNDERKPAESQRQASADFSRSSLKATLALHDNAVRCLRRERSAVVKIAKKHPSDVEAWQAGLRDFYEDHAGFVGQVMRLSPAVARAFAAQHGTEFEANGAQDLLEDDRYRDYERFEAEELVALALSDGMSVEDYFDRRLVNARASAQTHINVSAPVTIEQGAVDARTTVDVMPAAVTIAPGAVQATITVPSAKPTRKTITFAKNQAGEPTGAVIEEE